MKKILLIDNYDSFSYTIVFYLKELGYQCKIVKNDEFKKAKDLARFDFSHLIISPGPNSPAESKLSLKAIQYFKKDKKILGICLGHQCIGEVFGGKITPMPCPMQGKISRLHFKKNTKKVYFLKASKIKVKFVCIILYISAKCQKVVKF